MGFQLNGVETVLAVAPTGTGAHCENCCPDLRGEYFLMENCDLWMVTQVGDIFVLPFGDDTFQYKFTAKNYIPWRPYTHSYSGSCVGKSKDDYNKPFWKDYIGFQTDEFECVIFWRRNLIYHGAFDGRGVPAKYYYHERNCSIGWQAYPHKPFDLDKNGKIQWEKDERNNWQPKYKEYPDTYYYTQRHCSDC